MPTSSPEWNPIDEPPPPGRYMVQTEGECWFMGRYSEEHGWNVPDAEGLRITHWRELH